MRRHTVALVMAAAALALGTTGGVDRGAAKLVRDGNRAYEERGYDEAARLYGEALTRAPETPEIAYDRGNTLYRQGKFADAAVQLERGAVSTDRAVRQHSLYNLGNALHAARNLPAAADAYRRALVVDPTDLDAKINLEKVLRERQQQQQSQNQQGGEKRGEQGGQQGQQGQQDQQGQQGQEGQGTQDEPDSPPGKPTAKPETKSEDAERSADADSVRRDPEGEQSKPDASDASQVAGADSVAAGDLSREEAARILEAMREQEKELQKQRARLQRSRRRAEKDW